MNEKELWLKRARKAHIEALRIVNQVDRAIKRAEDDFIHFDGLRFDSDTFNPLMYHIQTTTKQIYEGKWDNEIGGPKERPGS